MNSNDSPGSDVDTRPVTLPAVAPLATVRDPPDAPPDAPRVQTVPATPAARSRRSTQSSASVPASVQVLDKLGELAGILVIGALCLLGRVDGMVAVGAILAIVGVNAGLRKVGDRVAGPGQGLGVIGLLVAAASGYGAQLLQGARVALPALLGAFVVLIGVGCASGPRSTDDAIRTTLTVTRAARDAACGPLLDGYLGRPQPVALDAPTSTVTEVAQRVRDWLCMDALAALLDLGEDLARPRPGPVSRAPADAPTAVEGDAAVESDAAVAGDGSTENDAPPGPERAVER